MNQEEKSRFSFFGRLRLNYERLVMGGDWGFSQPGEVRRNLRWLWWDGLFASASDNIATTYITLYILALGASSAQIGYLSSLSNLFAALVLLPGAFVVERIGRRKQVFLFGGGGIGRICLLGLAMLPLLWGNQALVLPAMGLSILRDTAGSFGFPAWMSISGNIIPLRGRGRYFASRNFIMSLSGMLAILGTGWVITGGGPILGYQLGMGLAFAIGISATFCFSRLEIEPLAPAQDRTPLLALLKEMGRQRTFLAFAATAAVWNFSINVAGPFFNVYLVEDLKASAATVAILNVFTSIAGLVTQRFLGSLSDRWGARRLQLYSSLLIWIIPLMWIFTSSPWHIAPINLITGSLWAVFNLACFNMLLAVTPDQHRARYSAIYQIVVTASLAAGAAVGGLVITAWGFTGVFAISGFGRLLAALLFAWMVKPKNEY